MKIRNGFVSNSSSSSFCVFGVNIGDDEKVKKFLKNVVKIDIEDQKEQGCEHDFNRDKNKFCPECGNTAWEESDYFDAYEYEDEIKKKVGLDLIPDCCDDTSEFFLGVDIQGLEGKGSAEDKIKKLSDAVIILKGLFPKTKPDFYSGSSSG